MFLLHTNAHARASLVGSQTLRSADRILCFSAKDQWHLVWKRQSRQNSELRRILEAFGFWDLDSAYLEGRKQWIDIFWFRDLLFQVASAAINRANDFYSSKLSREMLICRGAPSTTVPCTPTLIMQRMSCVPGSFCVRHIRHHRVYRVFRLYLTSRASRLFP